MTTATKQDLDIAGDRDFGVVIKPDTIRFERVLPGPIERVWAYLTEPDKLAKWVAAPTSPVRANATVEFTWDHSRLSPHKEPTPEKYREFQGMISRWRVTRFEPPRVLSWMWDEGTEGEGAVTVELTPRGNEVLLVLTHGRIGKPESVAETAGGWHTHLAILSDNLADRVPRPFWSTHAAIQEEYARRVSVKKR
jgi:uncharacterized protein YndB with AHSA1/START domain